MGLRIGHRAGALLDRALARIGRRLAPLHDDDAIAHEHRATLEAVRDHTMTSAQRVQALCEAVQYVVANGIPGSIVECGVWRGGSMMAVARTLLTAGDTGRDLYLFDTYEGMPPPSDVDRDRYGQAALQRLETSSRTDPVWAVAPLDVVKQGLETTGYPRERIHYVVGKVEDTVPRQAPQAIAVLRLDTDWYTSTKHELEHLFPRLVPGGVLIIDDYGHWEGARKATDEYLAATGTRLLLHRIDGDGRLAVKQGPAP